MLLHERPSWIMKNLVRVLCLVLFGCAHAQSRPVAIRGITVVDVGDASLHPKQTVPLANNRIVVAITESQVAGSGGGDLMLRDFVDR